ncbi:hypothetical protein QTP88_026521 [Uroleucon formosanum]
MACVHVNVGTLPIIIYGLDSIGTGYCLWVYKTQASSVDNDGLLTLYSYVDYLNWYAYTIKH